MRRAEQGDSAGAQGKAQGRPKAELGLPGDGEAITPSRSRRSMTTRSADFKQKSGMRKRPGFFMFFPLSEDILSRFAGFGKPPSGSPGGRILSVHRTWPAEAEQ